MHVMSCHIMSCHVPYSYVPYHCAVENEMEMVDGSGAGAHDADVHGIKRKLDFAAEQ